MYISMALKSRVHNAKIDLKIVQYHIWCTEYISRQTIIIPKTLMLFKIMRQKRFPRVVYVDEPK